jgi:S-(hydroxymethyl)glutathione dehydrogenase / alcohol dehydrogenase
MRAAVATGVNAPLVVEDLKITSMSAQDVVVQIAASGVCHSDVNPLHGQSPAPGWPLILGHEAAGVVVEVGAQVESLRVGDRVIGSFVPSCGHCRWCVDGQTNLCPDLFAAPRSVLARPDGTPVYAFDALGTFADQMVVSQRSVVKVETDLPAEQIALIGCGVTTGVCAVLNTARVTAGASAVILGAGGVGQSAVQGARIAGASTIIAVDPFKAKRDMAALLGATHTLDPATVDTVAAVRELTRGYGADFAFETAGRPDTARDGFAMLRRGGTLTLVGASEASAMPQWGLKEWMISEKRVLGSLYGSAQVHRDFPRLVRMAEAGLLRLDAMVSRRLRLDDINDGLDAIGRGEVIRSVVIF